MAVQSPQKERVGAAALGGPSSWLSRAHSTTEVRRWTVLAPPGGGSGSAQRRPLQLRAGSAGLGAGGARRSRRYELQPSRSHILRILRRNHERCETSERMSALTFQVVRLALSLGSVAALQP